MAFYPYSTRMIRLIINTTSPGVKPKERDNYDQLLLGKRDLISHLLWMLDRMEEMTDSGKAARWLGYIIGRLEAVKVLANVTARRIVAKDVADGNT